MPDQTKGRFWCGPIRTERNARNIFNVSGLIFLLFGVWNLYLAYCVFRATDRFHLSGQLLVANNKLWMGDIFNAGYYAIPGIALLLLRNRFAAVLAIFVSALFAVLATRVIPGIFILPVLAPFVLIPLLVFSIPLLWISWRAFRAALFRHRLKRAAGSSAIGEVFS